MQGGESCLAVGKRSLGHCLPRTLSGTQSQAEIHPDGELDQPIESLVEFQRVDLIQDVISKTVEEPTAPYRSNHWRSQVCGTQQHTQTPNSDPGDKQG